MNNPLHNHLTRIQRKKVTYLLHKPESRVVILDVYLKTDKGTCKVDGFGRVIWLETNNE